ncbi:UNVERIFIED_ORG: DNA modification methylase [Mycolicibacterium obuense]
MLGPYTPNTVAHGDANKLVQDLPDESIDVVVTSPPYWGQRTSNGVGVEADPREYVAGLVEMFTRLLPKMHQDGLLWLNIGDAYNTPVNWRESDYSYSTLGPERNGLTPENSAYTKNRHRRRAYIDKSEPWLTYGNLLALPYRLVIALSDAGWLFRGEVIWKKRNPMPEGRCRRPHRHHESIYLLAKSERHRFKVQPPVASVWEFPNEKITGAQHRSRFPEELPRRCIEASAISAGATVLDPYSGSGTTGVAAIAAGAQYLGFEIDAEQVSASQARIDAAIERSRGR